MEKIIYYNSMIEPKGGLFSAPVIIMIIIFAAIVILMFVLTFGLISAIRSTTLTLTDKELIIKSSLYGRKIKLENIRSNEIRAVNLDESPEYAISYRSNGMSLPNFKMGWMRLKNREKALVFISDKSSVAVIPTKDFLVLFSMDNIDEFINKMKALYRR